MISEFGKVPQLLDTKLLLDDEGGIALSRQVVSRSNQVSKHLRSSTSKLSDGKASTVTWDGFGDAFTPAWQVFVQVAGGNGEADSVVLPPDPVML